MKSLILLSLATICLFSAVFAQSDSSDDIDFSNFCLRAPFNRQQVDPISSCTNGENIGAYCYGDCPDGYEVGDSNNFTPDEEAITGSCGPQVYCWPSCPDGFDDQYTVCTQLTEFGNTAFLPDVAFGGSRYADSQSDCESENSDQTCEYCSDGYESGWVPTSNCGTCAEYCPVTCPDGYIQVDSYTCQKQNMSRPTVGSNVCPVGYDQTDDYDLSSDGEDPCFQDVPDNVTCEYPTLCYENCPPGWTNCGDNGCAVNGACTIQSYESIPAQIGNNNFLLCVALPMV